MDIISFIQSRISQAYTEQIWTMTIVGIYYGYLISNRAKIRILIRNSIKPFFVQSAVWLPGLAFILFILSRHFIYQYYNNQLKQELIKAGSRILTDLSSTEQIGLQLVNWSGVAIYALIILFLSITACMALSRSESD